MKILVIVWTKKPIQEEKVNVTSIPEKETFRKSNSDDT